MEYAEFEIRIDELDKSKNYIILCSIGIRGYLSDRILKHHGFKSKNIVGGLLNFARKNKYGMLSQNYNRSTNVAMEHNGMGICGVPMHEISN